MQLNQKTILGPVNRVLATAQNGLEVLRLGGLDTAVEPTPFEVLERRPMYRLRRYFPEVEAGSRPAMLLVPPMMLDANVYDVTRQAGAVGVLHDHGVDPWVIDFGSPDREAGGLARTLADHVVAVSQAVDQVRAQTGRDVHLSGYSQGGMFAYQAGAYRQSAGLASIVTFGSPADTLAALPLGLPEGLATKGAEILADHVLNKVYLPAWAARIGFQLMDPAKTAKSRIDFLRQLHDREALLPREQQRRFLEAEGWVAWSGPAIAELLKQFIVHNRMMTGGFVIEDRLVSLAEISCPVLSFVGEVDDIGQPPAVRGIVRAAPRADVYEMTLRAGHFGLVVGSTAAAQTWPAVAQWALWREGLGPAPDKVHPMEVSTETAGPSGVSVSSRITHGVTSIADIGLGAAKGLVGITLGVGRSSAAIAGEAVRTLPRLARLGQIQPHTRVSLGQLLDEQARRSPDGECFLFEDRVHTNEAVKERIDNVVRGLISLGVRQGAHVGVLMDTRPSALAATAALSRLGAVAVLLPPDQELATAVELGEVCAIIADPEHLETAARTGCQVYVLGGGDTRDLGLGDRPGVVDMERIDPDSVRLPDWYSPNPGLARDLAFVMFTRSGGRTEAKQITNRRWAVSAFGTATAAALGRGDTVYCLTPLHHPSGLLTSLGGAVAGGSRIALMGTFDPGRFRDEVHRYGVTVVSYTWNQLRELVDLEDPAVDDHHPIRLFIGSGMPLGLWERVLERFAPAQVVEFYASTEGSVVLANLSTGKPGAKGRPLPGTAAVELAAYDAVSGRFLEDEHGFIRQCEVGEVGRLMARARADVDPSTATMRGVFAQGDTWAPTAHLFRRDGDGDYWMVDNIHSVVRSAAGPVYTMPIADALAALPGIDVVVSYGIAAGEHECAVTAVTLRGGAELTSADLSEALSALAPDQRPALVHVVDSIPTTTWYRPRSKELRAGGAPAPGPAAWSYNPAGGKYQRLTKASLQRMGLPVGAARNGVATSSRPAGTGIAE
ncbi:AMP-binding protein [Rhodococcus sp. D2-41]|uniref:AMP-binding protein n=1 Tax=Speluncibacter jeojiensis TaxID=2710754 RepID=UPI0024104D45|nr:AMP-binding protein [Rhodococcus sp. D2-41]MDG3012128.1 AMP-binding protein [Rhodococcus sp. D2-41]